MKIEHVAIWVNDLERMKDFYCSYFNGKPSNKYINEQKGFSSYFITFNQGARLELMHSIKLTNKLLIVKAMDFGLAHIAISVGSTSAVDIITNNFKNDGYMIVGEPRLTGDGYYESCVLDPENNRIEVTV